jgi:aminopeptidase
MDPQERLRRYAELTVSVGANVQPGQLVVITGLLEHAALIREIGRAAYRVGARLVEPYYYDRHFTRALIELGPDASIGESAPWRVGMLKTLAEQNGAYIQVVGDVEPMLLADLDESKVGRSGPREVMAEWGRIINEASVNWTLIAAPNAGWAQQVFGRPDIEALWKAVEKAVRLDRDDPVAAWRDHAVSLRTIARALNERHLDALRYRGPGTDFTVGLLPSSRWISADEETAFGVHHIPNLPTEEVFTSPDRRRAEGTLRSTRPLDLRGTVVRDLEFQFKDGRIVDVRASAGADAIRAQLSTDENATRLGEVALVDGSSEVGKLGLTFWNTLFDENATCHIAFGQGFKQCVVDETERAEGMNLSAAHTDFMVGGPDVQIDGREQGGAWIPILHHNEFQIG